MIRVFASLALLFVLAACGPEPIWAPEEKVQAARYDHGGPASLTLFTVISNSNGSGAHTGLLINGSQRVFWDPAGTWWNPASPERNDLHYGLTPAMFAALVDYHARETYHVVTQEIQVSRAVAEQAIRLTSAYGAVPKAQCSVSTTKILRQLPGFESIPQTYYPAKTMDAFGALPGVVTKKYFDDDPDDNKYLLPPAVAG